MQISKTKLKNALEIVKPGLANKEIKEQTTSFAFIKGRVVTYNDEISISHPIEELELTGVVKAEHLYQLLNKLKKDEIEVSIKDNEVLLKSSRTKAGLALQSEIKLPIEDHSKVSWKNLPEDFVRHMTFAMGGCGRDRSKSILTCVHVSKEGLIESSDDLRITRCHLSKSMPVETFLIPATSVADMVKLNPIKIGEGHGWIHFKTKEDTIISCRILEKDIFPNIDQYLDMEGVEITLPKTTEEVLERASVFAKRDHILDETVEILLESKRLKMTSESNTGWFEEEININYDDAPVSFLIAPYLLRDILSETLTCTLCEDRLKFEGTGWIYVTALKSKIE